MSNTPPGSTYEIFDNDENQFVDEPFEDLFEAMEEVSKMVARKKRNASFTLYKRIYTRNYEEEQ